MYRSNEQGSQVEAGAVRVRPATIAPSTTPAAKVERRAATTDTGSAVTEEELNSVSQDRPSGKAIKSLCGEISMH
jgi:hypothetical protein